MSSVIPSLLLIVAALSATATAVPHDNHNHDHSSRSLFSGRWYHDDDHPVHALFKRGDTDGVTYAAVGTPEWAAGFPEVSKIDPTTVPQAWVDAYNVVKQSGKIPADVPVSTQSSPGTNPTYGNLDPNSAAICSSTYQCRNNETDIWDAPDGYFGSSFDDGPLPTSQPLYEFLHQNNVTTTHFYIGTNILYNPNEFLYAWETLQSDIAVHTWTHPYMTTLTDIEVVGELGFTMQLIHNSTGGRIPKYWRPPYGDSDNRVRAIAKEVFGLTQVNWNQDTEDWSIGEAGGATRDQVNQNLQKWLSGPKSPGLIILEHELTNETVGAFIQAYPLIAQNGWKLESVALLDGKHQVYQNSADDNSPVAPATVAVSATEPSTSSAAPSSTVSSSSSGNAPNGGTSSAKSAQVTGGSAQKSGAINQFGSPVFAGLATLLGLVGAAFVFQ